MAGLFGKAVKDATFSVTTSNDGSRSFSRGGNDRRGRSRGRNYNNSNRGNYGDIGRGRSQGRGRGGGSRRGRGGGRGRRGGRYDPTPRSYLEDEDDESMGDTEEGRSYNSRYTPYGPRPPSRRGFRHDDISSRLGTQSVGNNDWYKVVVYKGKNHDQDWLIRRLQGSCEETFQPVEFHYMGDSAMFFVEGNRIAEALKKISHSITVKDGSKLMLTIRPSQRPFRTSRGGDGGAGADNTNWTLENQQVVKECLSSRYNRETKFMNLADLFRDEILKSSGVQGNLSKYRLANEILKLIGENCPEIQTLDLSDNRLYNLDSMKDLATYAPGIQHLKLANTMLRNIEELDKLKGLTEVITIVLDGNPLCDKFDGKGSAYISAVRSRFPKVTNLDGNELPPPIGFDLATTTALPKVQDSYMGEPPIKELVLKFLEQAGAPAVASRYYKVYDSDDRQPLLDAYHDQAIFSMCVNTLANARDKGPRGPSLGEYVRNSRNMKKVTEPDRRASFIKYNRLSVVAMLNEFPSTKHDLSSFTVDVSMALSSCLSFSVRGLFMEASKNLRSFTRVFVAVPAAGGKALSIINDQLHIRNASSAEVQAFEKKSSSSAFVEETSSSTSLVAPTPSVTPVFSEPAGGATLATSLSSTLNLDAQQQQMVMQFSSQSQMNTEWSFKCLTEYGWDYNKAAQAFTELQSKNIIPADAFIKT